MNKKHPQIDTNTQLSEFSHDEKELISLLQKEGKKRFGDIVMKLKTSAFRGQEITSKLLNQKVISYYKGTAFLVLKEYDN